MGDMRCKRISLTGVSAEFFFCTVHREDAPGGSLHKYVAEACTSRVQARLYCFIERLISLNPAFHSHFPPQGP